MTVLRYALRSASFAAAYLTVFLTGVVLPWFPLPAITVAAVWLTAQTAFGRRRLDVIMLATAAAVGATLDGAGLLGCLVTAVVATIPALLFAVGMQRLLPGYWLGHGDRFRKPRTAAARLAVLAPVTAATGVVLMGVADTGLAAGPAAVHLVIGAITLFAAPFTVRAIRTQSHENGRRHLTVVR
ncbi:MAG TPA: hypothetical protein VN408_17095 [Actinoplanes sp.]|nr:hypothetical protein [Actinoplanes sp.]